jgi:mycofactocin precursor
MVTAWAGSGRLGALMQDSRAGSNGVAEVAAVAASAVSAELDRGDDGRDDDAIVDDVLVEDISIDGMCGVY